MVSISPVIPLRGLTFRRYVLSPTHLHEFKSADRIYSQPPVMSLYLHDQKLGSRSQEGSSSHKFMLKGRQTGSMHRGHSWVFRAETFDTMSAWYDDIKILTEKTGEERNAFVRRHARSISAGSQKAMSISSDGLEEDEADAVPYSANASAVNAAPPLEQPTPQRPQPGGRFPSDIQVNYNDLQNPAPASSASSDNEHDLIVAAGITPGGTILRHGQQDSNRGLQDKNRETNPYELSPTIPTTSREPESANEQPPVTQTQPKQIRNHPPQDVSTTSNTQSIAQSQAQAQPRTEKAFLGNRPGSGVSQSDPARPNSLYGDWMAPVAGGAVGGAVGAEAYRRHQLQREQEHRNLLRPNEDASDSPNTIPIPPKSPKRSLDQLQDPFDVDTVGGSDRISGTVGGMAIASGAYEQEQPRSNNVTSSDSAKMSEPLSRPTGALDGHAEHAQKTGQIFPKVLRHNTDVTISDLHIPGEFS